MLHTVKQKTVSTKNFVKKHRVAIAVTTTSVVWCSLVVRNQAIFNDFLKEHGLFDEFWKDEDAQELEALKA